MTFSLTTSTSWQSTSYRDRSAAMTPSVRYSGAEAPAESPMVSAVSIASQSIDSAEEINVACAEPAFAPTSTSRFELDEVWEPMTSNRSHSSAMALTAIWRFVVA